MMFLRKYPAKMCMNKRNRPFHTQAACLIMLITALAIAPVLSGCGSGDTKKTDSAFDDHRTGSMELKYADQFSVDYYDDGVAVVRIEDGLDYLVIDGSGELPDWLSEEDIKEIKEYVEQHKK